MKKERRAFTPAECEKIAALRKDGKQWTEIAEITGRPLGSLQGKFGGKKFKKMLATESKPRKYIKSRMPTAPAVERQRPMIALVGTPGEVTNSLRELFS